MRPTGVGDAPMAERQKVFGSSNAAGEVGGTDGDALAVVDAERIDNDNRKAGVIQGLERRTGGICGDENRARVLGSEQRLGVDLPGVGTEYSSNHHLESLGWC